MADKILWTAADAAQATDGKTSGNWNVRAVVIDSRVITGGELFVALPGERVDGHAFVADALKRGASAALVTHMIAGVDPAKLLIVPDVQHALEALGCAGRARAQAKIVAVTGSVGKTSAKEMLKLVLSAHGETFASHGNFNNHIGTPLNLANFPPSAEYAVFELGMNHAGEISALTKQVRPHVALITTVEAVHLEFFDSVEQIAEAKAEIFEGLVPNGTAILNRDNPQFNQLAAHAERILTFGQDAKSDVCLKEYQPSASGSAVVAEIAGKPIGYTLGTVGLHWARASLSALAVAHALGLDIQKTATALAKLQELPGRGSLHPIAVNGGQALLVDDSYNASPAAMRAAFVRLSELKKSGVAKGRLIAALGDMRELGESGPVLHTGLAPELQAAGVAQLFVAGPLMRQLYDAVPAAMRAAHAPDAAALLPLLRAALKPGDTVLVKGSHGSHMYDIAHALLAPEQETHAHAV